ncbi:uncharacterized protein LOC110442725 [Mizuhopecten yessoensis]|uniref:uncharacterized protein LOC110442725 n=1 Tax=Mizuhopecten yessoensis TaxID=6573 RepID=UPI000B45C4D1|nr:uncharacterized protein LOC110442725 [Mizuhopecten yessoensis]
MKKSDICSCRQDTQPQQGNDRPFKLPDALPDNQRILFKRTAYCGGGAQPGPGRKLESRGRPDSTDEISEIRPNASSNICTGIQIDIRCSRGTDSVDEWSDTGTNCRANTKADNSGNGNWIENVNSNVGGRPGISYANKSFLGSRSDHKTSISDFCLRNRPKCRTMTAENEMKVQYMFLKEQYGRICEKESLLRNQMALLQAEIILMETKAYHKSPANVRRITIDPIPIRRVRNKARKVPSVTTLRLLAIKVDPKVSPGRYFTTKATKATNDSKIPDIKKGEVSKAENIPNPPSGEKQTQENQRPNNVPDIKSYETGEVVNRCFYFDIPLAVVAPPYTKLVPEKVTRHRLPKLNLPKINTKGTKKAPHLVAQCNNTYQ